MLRASRGANKVYDTSILVDEQTFQLAQHDVESREIDFLTVVGRTEPVRVYEILGLPDAFPTHSRSYAALSPRAWRPIATANGTGRSNGSPGVWR